MFDSDREIACSYWQAKEKHTHTWFSVCSCQRWMKWVLNVHESRDKLLVKGTGEWCTAQDSLWIPQSEYSNFPDTLYGEISENKMEDSQNLQFILLSNCDDHRDRQGYEQCPCVFVCVRCVCVCVCRMCVCTCVYSSTWILWNSFPLHKIEWTKCWTWQTFIF